MGQSLQEIMAVSIRDVVARASWRRLVPATLVLAASLPWPSLASSLPLEPGPIRPATSCPENLETLVAALLRDLPSYANRVASRSLGVAEETGFGTVLLAGAAELEPIDLERRASSQLPGSVETDTQQVFFTTLERRYRNREAFNLQGFHWLFLAPSEDGWWLGPMYSSFASYPDGGDRSTPPLESSQGIIGQAVQLWLRDCRAGAIVPLGTGE